VGQISDRTLSGLSRLSGYAITNSKDDPMTKSIPLGVLNLLADERDHTPGRQPRYIHRPEDRTPRNGLIWSEVRDLVADGVVHNDWIGPGAAIAVLDYEQRTSLDVACLPITLPI